MVAFSQAQCLATLGFPANIYGWVHSGVMTDPHAASTGNGCRCWRHWNRTSPQLLELIQVVGDDVLSSRSSLMVGFYLSL